MSGSYEKRLMRVLEYIHTNPAGDLSLDRLADVAAMSRFHWHRVFQAMAGETCAQATRRIRLHRAAYEYLFGEWLPKSGEELRDAPSFEVYLNDPTDTAPGDLLTDICVRLCEGTPQAGFTPAPLFQPNGAASRRFISRPLRGLGGACGAGIYEKKKGLVALDHF